MSSSSGRLGDKTFLLTGYLRKRNTKRSSVLLKNWDKRWFALDDQAFIYANSHKDTSPSQAFRIHEILGLELIEDLPDQKEKHYDFEIFLPGRTLHLRPKSESQRRHWIAAINRARSLCHATRASAGDNSSGEPRHLSSFQGGNVYKPSRSGIDEFRAECERRSKSSQGATTAQTKSTNNRQRGLVKDQEPDKSAENTLRQSRLARDLHPLTETAHDKVDVPVHNHEGLSGFDHPSLRFMPTLSKEHDTAHEPVQNHEGLSGFDHPSLRFVPTLSKEHDTAHLPVQNHEGLSGFDRSSLRFVPTLSKDTVPTTLSKEHDTAHVPVQNHEGLTGFDHSSLRFVPTLSKEHDTAHVPVQNHEGLSGFDHSSLRFVPTLSKDTVPTIPETTDRQSGRERRCVEKDFPELSSIIPPLAECKGTACEGTASKGAADEVGAGFDDEDDEDAHRETEGNLSDDWSNWDSEDDED
eukprot:259747-Prorocentrum_minimum.AAC.6